MRLVLRFVLPPWAASAPAHPRPAGILDTVVNGIDSVLNPVASGVTCTNTNLITDELKEGRKPSDLLNQLRLFSALAPAVLACQCSAPYNCCIKDQIRKVMSHNCRRNIPENSSK